MKNKSNQFTDLSERVVFQDIKSSSDEFGGRAKNWQDSKEVWANIKPLKLHPHLAYYYDADNITYKITIRYQPQIHIGMRIKYKERLLYIKHLINIEEHNKYIEIIAIEKVDRKWK